MGNSDVFRPLSLDDIALTEEETAAALLAAREAKRVAQNRIAYTRFISRAPSYPTYTAGQLLAMLTEKGLIVDDDNEAVVKTLCLYFAADERFEGTGEGRSLDKGLMLFGNTGCGKSHLLRCFSHNPRQGYLIRDCDAIARMAQEEGFEAVVRIFANVFYPSSGDRNRFNGSTQWSWAFDDFGTEDPVSHYGNRRNTMAEILQAAYNNPQLRGHLHISTNLTGDDIEARYGVRIRSRMREMFNLLEFPEDAKDRRA